MTSPETTNPEVLAAAREAWAQWLDTNDASDVASYVRKGTWDSAETMLVAIAAINEYRRSGSGVVKALEWKDLRGHSFPDMWCATSPCGVYDIEERSASDSPAYVALGPHYAFIADKDSLEEAKAAAQADYERRIRSALAEPAEGETTANANAKAALEPFVSFAEDHVEKTNDGWQWLYGSKDRIVDWFGPSDFGRLLHFAQAISTGQGGRAEPSADREHRFHQFPAGKGETLVTADQHAAVNEVSPADRAVPCGLANPSSSDCPNMKEVGGGFEGERYRCDVCGKGYFLDYEDMK